MFFGAIADVGLRCGQARQFKLGSLRTSWSPSCGKDKRVLDFVKQANRVQGINKSSTPQDTNCDRQLIPSNDT